MKKLVEELEVGDKIELLDSTIGIVLTIKNIDLTEFATVYYENGMRTFCLLNDEVEIL